ncbi:hypothetical protein QE152_g26759 [Popillia japonica]|uniref:Uncharacterized protein n=1 Tax=Popillia japonica TaxID=7064 RepID=A0AAW1JXG0_POPJA
MSQFKDWKSLITSMKTEFSNTLHEIKKEFDEKLSLFKNEVNEQLQAQRNDSFRFEEVLQELNDRQARKQNIIMFNVPEQSTDADTDTRSAAKSVEVSIILQSILPTLNVSSVQSYRLGRLNSSKSVEVSIILQSILPTLNVSSVQSYRLGRLNSSAKC